jgi:hypothetical protein
MKDWDDWIEVIHTTALGADIWDHINPNKEKDTLQDLILPPKPELKDIKANATAYLELSIDEREQYRQLQSDYSYERKEYERKRKALVDIRAEIIKTIKRDFISYTHNTETVYDLLVKLKERIAPTDKIRKRELITTYKAACKPPKA